MVSPDSAAGRRGSRNTLPDDAPAGLRVASSVISALGESPVWHAASGALLWVDIAGRQLHRLDTKTGATRSWQLPEEPGCIGLVAGTAAPGRMGAVVVALRSGFHHFDLDDTRLTRLTDPLFDTREYRFNDGTVDSAGRFWAGTLHELKTRTDAGLYCLERGAARAVTGAGAAATAPGRQWGVRTSNGLAFSPDGRILYQSDTPAHVVYAYDFDARSGAITNRRVWWRANDDKTAPDYGGRPDGAAVDVDGCYWTAQYEGARVLQISPDGEVLQALEIPARCPTMAAFGGADLKTLYVTSAREGRSEEELRAWPLSGSLFAVPVAQAGLPGQRYQPPLGLRPTPLEKGGTGSGRAKPVPRRSPG